MAISFFPCDNGVPPSVYFTEGVMAIYSPVNHEDKVAERIFKRLRELGDGCREPLTEVIVVVEALEENRLTR